MKKNFEILCLLFLFGSLLLSENSHAQLKTYSFEQIDSLQIIEKRKIVVFIHTDWCKYCQAMKNTTFKNKDIIALLNSKFYFVDLNAEERKSIRFNGNIFEYKPTGNQTGINELATEIGVIDGFISYPTLCFLNDRNEILFQKNGFIESAKFIQVLNVFSIEK